MQSNCSSENHYDRGESRPIKRALKAPTKPALSHSHKDWRLKGSNTLNRRYLPLLMSEGIPVTEVSDHTGFPEMMDGRVKTLHPKIHGILGRRGTDDAVMTDNEIGAIDLVVVNLYPFEATVANPDCSLADAIENIDIGGPMMVRLPLKITTT